MAFLDNSGDIILDAVLTDTGRKRMAKGNFRITKFSVGDDEIDYTLYNKDHPSGSAYYDLEILQTPVLEAFTQMNANINYGLVSFARQDLLYIPSAKVNQKTFTSQIVQKDASRGVFFLADNTKTDVQGQTTSKTMESLNVSEATILVSGVTSGRRIFIETGIEDDNLAATAGNQATYITSVGLADSNFIVRFDRRFIGSAFGPNTGANFSNSSRAGASLKTEMVLGKNARASSQLRGYNESILNAAQTRVYSDTSSGGTQVDSTTNYSAFAGPRGVFTVINFSLRNDMTQADYSRFGRTGVALFGGSTLYDYIDTTVYVQGVASNVTIQLPIRIIKLAQT